MPATSTDDDDIDMASTIVANSDQLNADDLIGQTLTVRIARVMHGPDPKKQPIKVMLEGMPKKPWYPSKGMRRLMVYVWGLKPRNYVGKSLRLYRDATVEFGGKTVGGIRVEAMSDIPPHLLDEGILKMPIAEKRGPKKDREIKPLKAPAITDQRSQESREQPTVEPIKDRDDLRRRARLAAQQGTVTFTAFYNRPDVKAVRADLEAITVYKELCEAADKKGAPTEENPFGLDDPEMDADGELADGTENQPVVE